MRCFRAARPGFLIDRASVAALEFAVIAPVMVVLFLGSIELTNVIRVQAKLNVVAGQLVEMVADQSVVTEGTATAGGGGGLGGSLGDMCTGASYNMLPFNPANIAANIDNETVSNAATPAKIVEWADASSCPTVFTTGANYGVSALESIIQNPVSLFTQSGSPAAALVPGYSAVAVNMSYTYTNIIPFILGPSITLTAQAAVRPRSNTTITCTFDTGPQIGGAMNCPGY